tara:strand:- start:208 stop:489 length:282 start_codon:yes stop_codon:yes gene_type:complete
VLFGGVVYEKNAKRKAKKIIKFVFEIHIRLRYKFALAFSYLLYMQKRIKRRNITIGAKIEVITSAWFKLLNNFHTNNVTAHNREAKRLIIQIG